MKLSRQYAAGALFLFVSSSAVSAVALARVGAAKVTFSAAGPGGLKIIGTTADLSVSEKEGDLSVRVPLARLDTGIGLRNRHMREKYLEVDKSPDAELTVRRSVLSLPSNGAAAVDGSVSGNVSLHGKHRALPFKYHIEQRAGRSHVTGSVHLNMNDFAIQVPSYLGVTVSPEVDVNLDFEAS